MRIKIKLPQKEGGGWIVGIGKRKLSRKNATNAFSLAQNAIFRLARKEKTCVLVIYDECCSNETNASSNPHYLVWAVSCFLEDCLSKQILKQKESEYFQNCLLTGK
jgi:hypothetical protein